MGMNNRKVALLQIVAQLTTAAGEVDLVAVKAQYKAHLDVNPHLLDTEALAQRDVRDLDHSRRPRATAVQGTLFDPEAWLPIGEAQRVVMARATQQQCMTALQYRTQSHLEEVTDYNRDLQYWNARIGAFQPHHQDLEDVERQVFGWSG